VSTFALAASNAVMGPSRSRAHAIARRAILVISGTLLVAGAAQISIPLPFTPVPLTGQTFAVLLVGASLGAMDGLLSLALYVLVGAVGAPFFAGGASGWSILSGATGGYLIGFVLAAALVGKLAERGWDRSFSSSVAAFLTGSVVIYVAGILWLANALDASPISQEVLIAGLYPFIIGDLIKLYAASALLPSAWKLVNRFTAR